jgi:hypothetical protein
MKDKQNPNSSYTLVNMSKEKNDDTISNEGDEPTLKGKVKIKNVEHLNQGALSTCHIHLQEE